MQNYAGGVDGTAEGASGSPFHKAVGFFTQERQEVTILGQVAVTAPHAGAKIVCRLPDGFPHHRIPVALRQEGYLRVEEDAVDLWDPAQKLLGVGTQRAASSPSS